MLEPVVFQVPYHPYNRGETAGVPAEVAERLIRNGQAVRPGEPMKVLLPAPLQGSVPGTSTCAACGETFTPEPGVRHLCAKTPLTGEIFEAGFNRGPARRWGRRGR